MHTIPSTLPKSFLTSNLLIFFTHSFHHRYAIKCKFHHPPDVTPSWGTVAPATDVTIGLNKEVSRLFIFFFFFFLK